MFSARLLAVTIRVSTSTVWSAAWVADAAVNEATSATAVLANRFALIARLDIASPRFNLLCGPRVRELKFLFNRNQDSGSVNTG